MNRTLQYSTIASAYDLIAENWLDGRFSRTDGVRQHQHALAFLADDGHGWGLNVGCGCNTRFNGLLRDRGLSVEGIDLSDRMVALARLADPAAQVHLGDICTWQPRRSYRFISAWDSIWHVPLEMQRPLMLKLLGLLDPGGVLIFSAGGLQAPSEHTDNAMGPTLYYSTLGVPQLLQVIQQAGCLLRHFEFDQWPQPHLAIVAQAA